MIGIGLGLGMTRGGGGVSLPTVVNLLSPDLAGAGYRAIQSDGVTSRTVFSDGTNYYDAADNSLISAWWLPYGASLHVDLVNNRFYWNGAVRALGDLTAIGDGTYTLPFTSIGLTWSGDFTLQTEAIFGPSPALPSGNWGGWFISGTNYRYFTTAGTNATEWRYYQASAGAPNGNNSGTISLNGADYNSDGLTSFAGVNRALTVHPSGGFSSGFWSNAKRTTSAVLNGTFPAPTGNFHFGRNPANGTKATNTTFRKATLWTRALSPEFQRLANDLSFARPIHFLGDSFLTHGRILMRIKAAAETAGKIVGLSQDGVGGSTLVEQLARFDLTPDAYNSTLVVMDGSLEVNGATAVAALQDMVSKLSHNDWVYVQPNPINPLGDSRRTAWIADQAAIKAFCGDDHYIDTLDLMIAEDTTNIADGLWGPAMTGDLTHPTNPAGWDALSTIIYDGLVSRGLL